MSDTLTLEQRSQVHEGAVRLHREFAGTFGEETIERLLSDSLQRLAAARYQAFVPMLAAEQVNPAAVASMAEAGIDIAGQFPKPWTEETLGAADVIVTMGCGDACPVVPGKRYLDWDLDDPAGKPVEGVRPIRNDIEQRVRALLADLGVESVR